MNPHELQLCQGLGPCSVVGARCHTELTQFSICQPPLQVPPGYRGCSGEPSTCISCSPVSLAPSIQTKLIVALFFHKHSVSRLELGHLIR